MGGVAIPDITNLSLRARLAIAMRLFTGYCERRRLAHPEITAYLAYLWRFIGMDGSRDAFDAWSAAEPPLVGVGLGWEYPEGFTDYLANHGVPEREFRRTICSATEVLYTSLYGAANEPGSRRHLAELAKVAESFGVCFPDSSAFAGSRWSEGSGWGAVPSSEELSTWRGGGAEPLYGLESQ